MCMTKKSRPRLPELEQIPEWMMCCSILGFEGKLDWAGRAERFFFFGRLPWSDSRRLWSCRRGDASCSGPLGGPRGPLGVERRSRSGEDTPPENGRTWRDGPRGCRRRILCCSSDRPPIFWRTRRVCAGPGVVFELSCRTCSRSTGARNRRFPCVSGSRYNSRMRRFAGVVWWKNRNFDLVILHLKYGTWWKVWSDEPISCIDLFIRLFQCFFISVCSYSLLFLTNCIISLNVWK